MKQSSEITPTAPAIHSLVRSRPSKRLFKRIVHLIHADGEGGGPVSVMGHIKWYYKKYDIILLHGGKGSLDEYCQQEGIRTVQLPIDRIWKLCFGWIPLFYQLWKLKPDLLIVHGQWAGPLGALVGKLARVKRIIYLAHWPSFYTDWDLYRVIRNHVMESIPVHLCDKTICLSPENLYQYNIRYPKFSDKFIQKSNAFDEGKLPTVEDTDRLREEFGMSAHHVNVISVSRLASQKNISWLLRSWAIVQSQVPEARLWIVGSGEEEEKLRRLSEELGITGTCTFLGSQKNGLACVSTADIVAMTTFYEAHSHSAMEALLCGKPIVVNAADGVRYTVTDGVDGFLVPLGDIETFAERLITLCRSKELREKMGEAGQQSVQRFSLSNVMKGYSTLIEDLIRK